eukprot:gnl/MRDRNA2_/MRDRNA2_31262_c0_seq1.p1 gnl/MRDRNA2_/MRDRNA2_31262_c0~~gnl/MRDRNA2_/MRDRNA2_31262_c0_seq1.p1  ORF type:complete len:371 (-),score=114.33 gnl/MRDRNA2_/MRDRNA2_31262_c0_seq1:40-1152(-)
MTEAASDPVCISGEEGDKSAEEIVNEDPSAASADSEDGVDDQDDPRDLKARGNAAWQNGETQAAVEFWNAALKGLIESMKDRSQGKPSNRKGLSPLSEEYRALEKSLYLNLGQGYLRLGEPKRTLRACQVVLHEDPSNAKAIHRTAEAYLALQEFDKVKEWAEKLPSDAEGGLGPDGQRLLQRAQAAKKAEIKRQKATAKAMFKGGYGFSDDKPQQNEEEKRLKDHMPEMGNPAFTMAIGEAAAKAARAREERLNEGPAPPEAQTNDLDAFRARIMAKSAKYRASAAKSMSQSERAQRAVKLDWIRSHADQNEATGDFESFQHGLRQEVKDIEEVEAKAAEEEDESEGEDAIDDLADSSTAPSKALEEMD